MFRFFGHPPALYMIAAVVSFSIIPVLFDVGNAADSPFLFSGIWQGSVGLGIGAVILLARKRLPVKPTAFKGIISHCWTWLMLISVIVHCGGVLFAFGLAYVDVSMAAILHETWPVILIVLVSRFFKNTDRYRPLTWGTWSFVTLALAGVTMVILSHNEAPHPLLAIGSNFSSMETWIGVLLVSMAALFAAARSCTFLIGASLAREHSTEKHREAAEIVFVIIVTCICQIFAGIVLCSFGWGLSETISSHQLEYAIFGGLVVSPFGLVAFRAANMTTKNLGVNALAYATPLVTLLWLWMTSTLNVSHWDYLIIGAMGIAAANLLINAKADKRIAYSALVVSLWVFGTIIYFHEGYTTDVPLELPVTVFILVLAFRVDRLARRTSQEESWVFEAFQRLKVMASRRQIDCMAGETLLKIDRHKTPEELAWAYRRLVVNLERAGKRECAVDEVRDIRHMVDSLAHSRQQGAHFGELVAIFFAGSLIVGGLLLFNGEREIYSDFASFLLSSVVVFLFFNIVDLQNDRRDQILIRRNGRYEVKFDDAESKYGQQKIAVGVSSVIVVVFGFMFASA